MKPAPFNYLAPVTVDEALAHLTTHGYDAKLLAGGQSLVPLLNFRLAQPSVIVDINNIPEIAFLETASEGGVRIGALTRESQLEKAPLIAKHAPLLHAAMPYIAYPQVRNRGTFGGSIAHADPSAELPAVAVAMNGRHRIANAKGERWVSAEEFTLGLFTTVLEPGEMLIETVLPPMPAHSGWSFLEISRRKHDFAMAGVAAIVTMKAPERCQDVRMVFFSVGDRPILARQAAEILQGERPTAQAIEAAATIAADQDVDPTADIHASAEFRRHLVRVLAQRALSEAFSRAGGD